ncbi:protein PF3D7_1417600 isoform X2 [Daktulosphaira vitifoliae]|uniref:protein PF3D7_1417600 isoform X2 n=1 Tax=Daktulosphaira vitifoliae TaxID=58002 RepID=UPI0021A9BE9B|nr:protein PF3D7_1417600 isoform X2 [Daktulosphaira vitifoliae]
MSIPPLIPASPPPITKLDWDEDEDDYPHLAMEIPSESSLSPVDGRWIPDLPFDTESSGKLVDNSKNFETNVPAGNLMNDNYLDTSNFTNHRPSLNQTEASDTNINGNISLKVNEVLTNEQSKKTKSENLKFLLDNSETFSLKDLSSTETSYNDINNDKSVQMVIHIENQEEKYSKFKLNSEVASQNCKINKSIVNNHSEDEHTQLNNSIQHGNIEKIDLNSCKISSDNKPESNNAKCCNINSGPLNINNLSSTNQNLKEVESKPNLYFTSLEVKNDVNPSTTEFSENYKNSLYMIKNTKQAENIPVSLNNSNQQSSNESVLILENYEENLKITVNDEENLKININDEEFDEFCDFHACPTSSVSANSMCLINESNNEFKDFGNCYSKSNYETKSDKINEFNAHIFNDAENVDDFCDFESSSTIVDNDHLDLSSIYISTLFDYNQICKDIFHGDYSKSEIVDIHNLDNEINKSYVWKCLKDLESSPALDYNWSKSESNNVFLSSLSIDSRNILYGALWNTKVPRFAANMSNNPLEPLKACNDASDFKIPSSISTSPQQETVPDPEFDWKSSGLVNPLDLEPQNKKEQEAIKLINEEIIKNDNLEDDFDKFFSASPECTEIDNCKINASIENENSVVPTESIQEIDSVASTISTPIVSNEGSKFSCSVENFKMSLQSGISLEAQKLLDNLPDLEVLQKPYLVFLRKGENTIPS